jgi:hypothetical protein
MLYRLSYVRADANSSPFPGHGLKSDFRPRTAAGTLETCGDLRR